MADYDFDLFTIGAGSGGVRASRMSAAKGARVAVAEAQYLGGTCVNVGCVPKKLLVYAAGFSSAFRDAAGFGWTVDGARFDWKTLIEHKDAEIRRLNAVYERLLHGAGCELVRGWAQIVDPHRVAVRTAQGEERVYTAANILIATGGEPVRPTERGTERAWVSDDVFALEERPRRLMVVGGGYIALEMASIFQGLGTEVHLVYRGPHPLRGFDDDVRTFLCDELRKQGMTLHLNTQVECLEEGRDGAIDAVLAHDEVLEVDAALYAIGRRPRIAGLGLEAVGVAVNARGAVVVDDHFRTSVDSIWALGDVTDRVNLTPVAIAEGMAISETLFGAGPTTVDYREIPTAVFSSPPVATVGQTEAEARVEHGAIDVYTSEFRPLMNTVSGNEGRTFMKMIVHPETDRVLGVHICGVDGPEIVQAVAVAMKCGATKAHFDRTIGLHPTAAEELVTLRNKRPDD